ncbi:hypothetical protein ACV35P_32990, partial [Pseudomonas aeruginosa]
VQADRLFWCGQEQGCARKLNQSLRRAPDGLRAAHGSAPSGWKSGEAHAALAEHGPLHKTPRRALFDLKNTARRVRRAPLPAARHASVGGSASGAGAARRLVQREVAAVSLAAPSAQVDLAVEYQPEEAVVVAL